MKSQYLTRSEGITMNTILCAFFAGLMAWTPASATNPARPNVIVIMADDLGAEGLASYGSTIYNTPNLDKMSREGMRFNNAYATPLCTPSRVMLMTGVYPDIARLRFAARPAPRSFPGWRLGNRASTTTPRPSTTARR